MNMRDFFEEWWMVLVVAGWFLLVAAVAMNDGWHRRNVPALVEVRP